MKVAGLGLWHLGTVTAACVAETGVLTVGIDDDAEVIAKLNAGEPPLYEPGLAELVRQGLASGKLSFTTDAAKLADADIVWICHDTPVDDDDRADVEAVVRRVEAIFPQLKNGAIVLVSAQLPVGTVARLEKSFASQGNGCQVDFACSPENLRLGRALDIFRNPGRIVIGTRREQAREKLSPLLSRFCQNLIWMSIESAEMVKHALNSYLATCVTFTNEIASICETVAADMSEVEAALRLDPRIGKKAYVRAGSAFGGGTLARDVQYLKAIARDRDTSVPVLNAVLESNDHHKGWVVRHLRRRLGAVAGRRIGVLGLAYKAGTDAIRRSVAIEVIEELIAEGAELAVFDPKVATLPEPLKSAVSIVGSAEAVFKDSEAVVLATEWPQFRELDFAALVPDMKRALLIDQNGFAAKQLSDLSTLDYVIAGRLR